MINRSIQYRTGHRQMKIRKMLTRCKVFIYAFIEISSFREIKFKIHVQFQRQQNRNKKMTHVMHRFSRLGIQFHHVITANANVTKEIHWAAILWHRCQKMMNTFVRFMCVKKI